MSTPKEPGSGGTPDEVDLLLPWYAVDRLGPEEADRVAAALAHEPALAHHLAVVRAERAETVALNQDLGAPSRAARDALFARIAASEPAAGRARRAGQGLGEQVAARLAGWLTGLSPGALAWSGAAAALVITVQAGFLVEAYRPRSGPGYETASGPVIGSVSSGRFVLVAFAPTATIAQIEVLLRKAGGVIVDGPRAGGLYRVRLGGEVEGGAVAALEALRSATNSVKLVIPEAAPP